MHIQAYLRTLGDDLAINTDHRAPVVIQPAAVTANLVGIQITPARFRRCAKNQLEAGVELAKVVVRSGSVCDDFGAREAERNVRRIRGEELLARFRGYGCVSELKHAWACVCVRLYAHMNMLCM